MVQEIRRAREADLKEIFAIESAVQKAPWAESVFADIQRDEDAYFFVADEGGSRPVAFLIAISGDDFLEILNFAVAPASQRQGIGGRLFQYVLNEASKAGISSVRLEVRESNAPAIAIYTASGLEVVGMRKRYYNDNGENALLMTGEISLI